MSKTPILLFGTDGKQYVLVVARQRSTGRLFQPNPVFLAKKEDALNGQVMPSQVFSSSIHPKLQDIAFKYLDSTPPADWDIGNTVFIAEYDSQP